MRYFIIFLSLSLFSFAAMAAETDSLAVEKINVEEEEIKIIAPDSLWDSANTAYINGQYGKAINLYSSILDQGLISDKLYFNLGNAHYKKSNIARAILYYHKALLISPNDSDILYNLKVAQSQTRDQIEEIPEFFLRRISRSISRTFNCTGWTVISLAALVILAAMLLIFLLSGSMRLRKIGFGIGLLAALIFTITTVYALDERREIMEHNKAVIMSRSISIKSSPDHSATDLFMLHNGTTVKILREIDGWYEIMIADGKKGWIENKRLERI